MKVVADSFKISCLSICSLNLRLALFSIFFTAQALITDQRYIKNVFSNLKMKEICQKIANLSYSSVSPVIICMYVKRVGCARAATTQKSIINLGLVLKTINSVTVLYSIFPFIICGSLAMPKFRGYILRWTSLLSQSEPGPWSTANTGKKLALSLKGLAFCLIPTPLPWCTSCHLATVIMLNRGKN